MQARWAHTLGAQRLILATQAIHICRRTTDIGDCTSKIGHLGYSLNFAHNRSLATRRDKFALMCRDCAERATSEATPMDIYRVLNHLPRRDIATPLVTRMRCAHIWEVECRVQLLARKCRVHRVYHNIVVANALNKDIFAFEAVALHLLLCKVFAKGSLILSALLEGVQHHNLLSRQSIDKLFIRHKSHLAQGMQKFCIVAVTHCASHLADNSLAHSVEQEIGSTLDQDRGFQSVLPIVVVGKSAQRSLDTTNQHGGIRKEIFQNLRVGRYGIVGAETCCSTCGVGIVRAESFVGGVVVYHRVHNTSRNAEAEARSAKLLEIAQVVTPIWLRHNRHTQPLILEESRHHRRTERWVVDIGIARKENYIDIVPPELTHLLDGCWQKRHSLLFRGVRGVRGVSVNQFSILNSQSSIYSKAEAFE